VSIWTEQNGLRYITHPSNVAGTALSDNFRWLAGNSLRLVEVGSDYAVSPGEMVVCDTTNGPVEVSLPVGPPIDSRVSVSFRSGTTNDVTINRSGGLIHGRAANMGLFVPRSDLSRGDSVVLRYAGGGDWLMEYDGRIPHVCRIDRASPQTLPSNTTVLIDFDTVISDTAGISDLTQSRVTIRRRGLYEIVMYMFADGWLTGGSWQGFYIHVNADREIEKLMHGENATPFISDTISLTTPLEAGDYIRGFARQTTPVDRSTSSTSYKQPFLSVREILL